MRLCGPSNRCLDNWLVDRLITNRHEMKGSGEETSILTLLLLPCHRDKRTSVSKPTKAVHSKDGYFAPWKWEDQCVPRLYLVWHICPETSIYKSDVPVETRGEIRHYKNHHFTIFPLFYWDIGYMCSIQVFMEGERFYFLFILLLSFVLWYADSQQGRSFSIVHEHI